MVVQDDRTEEFKAYNLVVARDSAMSGWGKAKGGTSYCAWAVQPEWETAMLHWVQDRREMRNVHLVGPYFKPPRTCAHFHIYMAKDHPAFERFWYLHQAKGGNA